MKRSRGVKKVTSREEWNGNVEHTFERDSFQFAVPPITNEERLVLLIKPETQRYIKPSSIPISVGISFICRSSQSGYFPFDNMMWALWHQNQQTYTHPHKTDTQSISPFVVTGHAHTLESHLSNWMAVGNVYGVGLLVDCYAVGMIKTSTRSKSILTPLFATPSMNTHQSWDNKSEEEEEEEKEEEEEEGEERKKERKKEEKEKQIGLLPDAEILHTECERWFVTKKVFVLQCMAIPTG